MVKLKGFKDFKDPKVFKDSKDSKGLKDFKGFKDLKPEALFHQVSEDAACQLTGCCTGG